MISTPASFALKKKNQTDRDEFDVGLGKTECTAKLTRSPTAAFLEKRS